MEQAEYLDAMVTTGLYPRPNNLRFFLEQIFHDLEFENRRVLDIGGGSGFLSFFAASRGASEVICLEPELDGSTAGASHRFNSIVERHDFGACRLVPQTFQDYCLGQPGLFDIVILHASINHLDEDACIRLRVSPDARRAYQRIFSDIAAMSAPGARIVMTDVSPLNFFPAMRVQNPFARSIEWHKHQTPETWIELLREAGYSDAETEWLTFNTLRGVGKFFLGNKCASYFLTSDFVLRMKKP
ncbi:MAG: methyltransferase domain-containing protein [Gammaproteobacteria bacterium]